MAIEVFMSKIIHNRNEYPSFLSNALAIQGSITPKVLKNVFWVVAYSCCISIICYYFPMVEIRTGPFEYAGLVLGLVLVFRINAGYDRWWEARKIWGDIVNKTRNLGVLILNQDNGITIAEKKELIELCSLVPYFIKKHLRDDESLADVKHLIQHTIPDIALMKSNKPLFISSLIAKKLNAFLINDKVSPFVFLQMEKQREKLIDSLGACERILNTPMPFVMAIKSRRFLLIFILMLPFSLVGASLYLSPLIMAIVSYALFSLDQIGIELQNPFYEKNLSHHPLRSVCKNIETDLFDLLNMQSAKE